VQFDHTIIEISTDAGSKLFKTFDAPGPTLYRTIEDEGLRFVNMCQLSQATSTASS
jgi:hypothetical protein